MPKRRNDWLAKAGASWSELAALSKQQRLTTYKEHGTAIGLHHRAVPHALGLIQRYCLEANLPPLTCIVVNALSRTPGGGSIVADREDLPQIQDEVFRFPWEAHANPFQHFGPGESVDDFVKKLAANPNNGPDIYSKICVRGIAQQVFRSALLEIYGNRCAMCGLSFTEALKAAHIIPWSEATFSQRMDPRNGLLLCATHHELFDAQYIGIDDDFRIRYCDPDKTEFSDYTEADENISVRLHGIRLKLPRDARHWPSQDCLKQRRGSS